MSWMEWDFADPNERRPTAADLIAAIREIALPFFGQFRDTASALEVLVDTEGLTPTTVIEFAQAHFGRERAERVGLALLTRRPEMRREFLAAEAEIRAGGLPNFRRQGWASELATVAVLLDLDLGAEGATP